LLESQTREPFGTVAWWAWYERARNNVPPPIGSARTQSGSIDALAVAYYASAQWQALRPTTRRTYKGILDRFRDLKFADKRCGSLPVAQLQPKHVRKIIDGMADRSAAANNLLRIIRIVMTFAVERGWRDDNPALHIKPLRRRSEGFMTWSEDDIAKFESRWSLGTKERLAFDLLLYTAQRSGDVRRMGPQHVSNGYLRVVQEKTGEVLELPLHPRLQSSLAAVPTEHLTFIVTKHGEPYTSKGFSQWVSEAANLAGLPKAASAHGLRKAAARRLAEAGCSAHMIMSVTGHRSLREVERYTRAAGQKLLATSAMQQVGRT
jgi:integrase